MSLVSQIATLATRIAQEFNAVRSEMSSLSAGAFETGTSFPDSPEAGQTFFETGEKVAYIYSGESWLPMTLKVSYDGLSATANATSIALDGKTAVDEPNGTVEAGTA